MRKKELKLIITFESTVQAMRLERVAKEAKAPGRLIPVPREITAGCGLAYSAPLVAREELDLLIQKYGLKADQMVELEI
jgi:hypothetical protein